MTRCLLAVLMLAAVSCGHARPRKGHAAKHMPCKRSGVELSDTFEHTWRGDAGRMHLRYQVSASCHGKAATSSGDGLEYWRDCRWGSDDWVCEDWQAGTAPPVPGEQRDWIRRDTRGR